MKNAFKVIRLLSLLLCLALVAAAAGTAAIAEAVPAEIEVTPLPIQSGEGTADNPYQMGKGETVFSFDVRTLEGDITYYTLYTDQASVGQALLELGLIEGDEGPYGLYVKVVAGTRLEYETDGHYWAFYINDEYAMSSADLTDIEPDAVYSFRAE